MQQNSGEDAFTTGESWIILNDIEKSIKSKVEAIGTPLSDWNININYGIKTGFNDAFIISSEKREEILGSCESEDERSRTDAIIRPILRGRDICRYACNWADLWIINTHNGVKGVYDRVHIEDYPAIKAHLDGYWTKIESRADQGDTPYNLRNCAYMDDLSKPKIVWGNLNQKASYAFADESLFINAPGTMIVPASKYLLGVLNSKLGDFYIRTLGVVRNGGYFEYKPMFISKLPVIQSIAESVEETFAHHIENHNEQAIDQLVYELYGLTEEEKSYVENW